MVGGIIEDFFILDKASFLDIYKEDFIDSGLERWKKLQEDNMVAVRFLVRETPPYKDTCMQIVAMPKSMFGESVLIKKEEDKIWWQNGKAYLTIWGVQDTPFNRIGSSGGSKEKFNQLKSKVMAM